MKQLEQLNHGYSTLNAQNLSNNVIEERLYNDLQQPMEKKRPIGMYTTQNVMKQPSNLTHTHSLSPFHRTQPQNQFLLTQNQLYQQQT